MWMTCHDSEECFNQRLFIVSKELERCLGIPHPIVQKKALNPKTFSAELIQNFLMETE